MRCASRPSQAGERGARRSVLRAIAVAFALAMGGLSPAKAQTVCRRQRRHRRPASPSSAPTFPLARPSATSAAISSSASAIRQPTASTASGGPTPAAAVLRKRPKRRNSAPGSRATASRRRPMCRATSPATGARPGAAWPASARPLAPGVNVGFSVDQSHSKIDVPLAFQWATLDLTQLGASFSVDKGPWTIAGAVVHGFGQVNSNRDTGAGFCDCQLQRAESTASSARSTITG